MRTLALTRRQLARRLNQTLDEFEEMGDDLVRLTAENASLRDQLARETALRIAAEQRAEAMAW